MTLLSTHSLMLLAPVGWRMELGQEWLSSRVRNLLVFPSGMCLLGVRGWRERSQRSQTLILLCPDAPCDLMNPFSSLDPSFCICSGVRHGPAMLPLVGASWACLCLGSSLARCSVSALSQPETMGQTGRVTHRPQTQSLGAPPWTIFSPWRWSQKRIFHS